MPTHMDTNFKISKVRRDANYKKERSHMHSHYEVLYSVSGECNFLINHNIYKMGKGDLAIIAPGDIHESTYGDDMVNERYVIGVKESELNWMKNLIGEDIVQDSLHSGIISIPDKRRDYVEALMDKMLFESQGTDILSPAFIQAGLLELFLFVIRCQNFEENIMKEIDVDNRLIQEIATYIYDHYDQKISLDEMAERFHISRSYLSKKFKLTTGLGFKEYLIHVRIKNACRLLLDTDHSITDIAFECGFSDSNYFGDAFRRVKGVSPNKYRKNKETM